MQSAIEKTVVLRLTEFEAGQVKMYLDECQKYNKDIHDGLVKCAKKLICKIEEIGIN